MSKLAALLRRVTRNEPAPMGFALSAGREKNPGMLIAVALESPDAEQAQAAIQAGADSVQIENADLEAGASAIRATCAAVEAPCGLRSAAQGSNASAAHDLGLDYLTLTDGAAAALLNNEETGYVLSVDAETPDTTLRILESMTFDALDAGELQTPLTIRQQIGLRRISGIARKPLILRVSGSLSREELESLRDAGVAVVMLVAGADLNAQVVSMRQAIGGMRPRRRRRDRQETVAVLPSIHQHGEEEDAEEEE